MFCARVCAHVARRGVLGARGRSECVRGSVHKDTMGERRVGVYFLFLLCLCRSPSPLHSR